MKIDMKIGSHSLAVSSNTHQTDYARKNGAASFYFLFPICMLILFISVDEHETTMC
jgi:hypothetical protein